jgi:hypothetical protein
MSVTLTARWAVAAAMQGVVAAKAEWHSMVELMHLRRLVFWSAALLRRFRVLWRKPTESDFIIFLLERL